MANWITTIIKAKDTNILEEKLLRLPTAEEVEQEKIPADELLVDFNKVIPMPSDLNITAGAVEWAEDKYGFGFFQELLDNQDRLIKPILQKLYHTHNKTQADFVKAVHKSLATHLKTFVDVYNINYSDKDKIIEDIDNVVKGFYNLNKYGEKNWYEWSYKHWGTKWNAHNVNYTGNVLSFETANGLCLPVLVELSKYTDLTVLYADEDTGRNYGILKISNGEITRVLTDENRSVGESMACRDEDIEQLEDLYSEENYTDEEIQEFFSTDRQTFLKNETQAYNKTQELITSLF